MGVKNNTIRKKLNDIEILLKRYMPDFIIYLDNNLLNHEFFTTQWIITIFANSIKPHYLYKIWDFSFIYGWKFLDNFILAILLTFKKVILNYDVNHLSSFMKNLLKSDLFDQSFLHILNLTFNLIND